LTVTTKDTKNSAIDYAILGGNYLMAYYLYMQKVKIRKAEFYYKAAKKRNQRQKIDYPKFLDCLDAKIHPNEAPSSFVIRKKRKVYKDPVIDPNEPWKNWFVRVANFKDPPLVERDSLPENM
jgi:hypothetical protein